jgi:hypothetical protein
MPSIVHSVLALGTTVLSLSILFLGGHVINILSQKLTQLMVKKCSIIKSAELPCSSGQLLLAQSRPYMLF